MNARAQNGGFLRAAVLSLAFALHLTPFSVSAGEEGIVAELGRTVGKRRVALVHIGAGAGETSLALARKLDGIVHGLEPDAALVEKAGEEAVKAGLCGRVWIERGPLHPLPHVSNLANVILVEDWKKAAAAGLEAGEVMRVLSIGGLGCVGGGGEAEMKAWLAKGGAKDARVVNQGGVWILFTKPRPESMDEWTHKWHDGSRNSASQDKLVKVPKTLHWINGEPYTNQMRHFRTAAGRVFFWYDCRAGVFVRKTLLPENLMTVEALDAYSGLRLWKKEYEPPGKGFPPIAAGDRLVQLVGGELKALHGATGEELQIYKEAGAPDDGAVSDGVLVCYEPSSAKGLDLETGGLLWELKPKAPPATISVGRNKEMTGWRCYCNVAADGMGFLFERAKTAQGVATQIKAVDLKTGKEVWSFEDPALGTIFSRCFYYQGRLVVGCSKGYAGLPVKAPDQKPWLIPVASKNKEGALSQGFGHDVSKNFFAVNGLVWVREGLNFWLGGNRDTSKPQPHKVWTGFDPRTGEKKKSFGYDEQVNYGWQQRCYPDLACPEFLLSSNNELGVFATGEMLSYRAMRGMCGEGPFFGNGLFYVPTHYCINCYPMLRGNIAAGGDVPPPTTVRDEERLEKGPVYNATPAAAKPFAAGDWPMFRGDRLRTGGCMAETPLPLDPTPVWKFSAGDRMTQPIVADGRVYAAVIAQGRIVALDEKSGRLLWSRVCGPRIDMSPTLHGELLLFGSHDGRVHALRASDGAVAWRFHAAPERRRMLVNDRIESSWPVMGSVVVHEGVLYCCGGRIGGADGGMHLFALDALTGQPKWHTQVGESREKSLATGANTLYFKEPVGQLMNAPLMVNLGKVHLYDKNQVWRFKAATGELIVPPSQENAENDYSADLPWTGWCRPTNGYVLHGEEAHPEMRHPFEAGTPLCAPAPDRVGLVFKRSRMDKVAEYIPAAPKDLRAAWTWKDKNYKPPWTPLASSLDPYAFACSKDTAFVAGGAFPSSTQVKVQTAGGRELSLQISVMRMHEGGEVEMYSPTDGKLIQKVNLPFKTGELQAISLTDGKILDRVSLPARPVLEGLSVAHGKVFISLLDGTLICLSRK